MQKRIGLRGQCGKGILANTLATHAPSRRSLSYGGRGQEFPRLSAEALREGRMDSLNKI